MVSSYMLVYENGQNPYEMRRNVITEFIENNTTIYVSDAKIDIIVSEATKIMKAGIKYKDACHVSCALLAKCEYFLTTDRRLLKYETNDLKILNPLDFIKILEE